LQLLLQVKLKTDAAAGAGSPINDAAHKSAAVNDNAKLFTMEPPWNYSCNPMILNWMLSYRRFVACANAGNFKELKLILQIKVNSMRGA
jgi:hypothetical protein